MGAGKICRPLPKHHHRSRVGQFPMFPLFLDSLFHAEFRFRAIDTIKPEHDHVRSVLDSKRITVVVWVGDECATFPRLPGGSGGQEANLKEATKQQSKPPTWGRISAESACRHGTKALNTRRLLRFWDFILNWIGLTQAGLSGNWLGLKPSDGLPRPMKLTRRHELGISGGS